MTAEPRPPEPELADAGVILPRSVADALLAHARAQAPKESCGLIAGDARRGVGAAYHPARNALASPYRFEVHPEDLVRILGEIEGEGGDLVAIVHSHPRSPAVPSAVDRREARYPVMQLVISLRGDVPELRAWWIDGGDSREVPVRVEEGRPV